MCDVRPASRWHRTRAQSYDCRQDGENHGQNGMLQSLQRLCPHVGLWSNQCREQHNCTALIPRWHVHPFCTSMTHHAAAVSRTDHRIGIGREESALGRNDSRGLFVLTYIAVQFSWISIQPASTVVVGTDMHGHWLQLRRVYTDGCRLRFRVC